MKRKLVGFVTTSLHVSGLKLLQQKTPYHQRWILFGLFSYCTLCSVSMIVLPLVNDDTTMYKYIDTSPYLSVGIIIHSGIITLVGCECAISEMLCQMDQNVYEYPDEDLLDMKYEWYLDEGNLIIIMIVIFCMQMSSLVFLCIPAVYELCSFGRINTFIYPGWFPWNSDTVGLQLATMVAQFFHGTAGLWLNQMLIMPVLLVFCEFLRQYKRLKKAVVSLKERSKPFEEKPSKWIDLICFIYLKFLIRNFCLFEIWFSKLLAWELALCAFSLAIAVFVIISADSLSEMFKVIILVAFINVNLFARCLMGEIFFDLNDDIAYTIFTEIEWYDLSKENQKLLVMFHQMARQPLTLFAFRIFAITRVMFARLTRTTFSVYNVINVSL